jgi:hypothetical protein
MPVTVDSEPLAANELGLHTVGQVLSHLQGRQRLVVHMLIDGQEPDLDRMSVVRQRKLDAHTTLFIETTHPSEMALDVLADVEAHLDDADRLRTETADLLMQNQTAKAMEKLSGAFRVWFHAQESVQKVAQLLRIDLNQLKIDGRPMSQHINDFGQMLKQIRTALENRDFVLLSDVLTYETTETTAQWRQMIDVLRGTIGN